MNNNVDLEKYKRILHAILVAAETPQAAENTVLVIWEDVIEPMIEELQVSEAKQNGYI